MKGIIFLFGVLIYVGAFKSHAQQECNIVIDSNIQSPSCSGGMDGAIQIMIRSGEAPFSYSWSNGESTKDISSLTSGDYTLTVRDRNGCVAKAEFVLQDEKADLSLLVEQKAVSNSQYRLKVVFNGGVAPSAINIKNLSKGIRSPQVAYNGQSISKGVYLLEAFNNAGCSVLQKITVDGNESSN